MSQLKKRSFTLTLATLTAAALTVGCSAGEGASTPQDAALTYAQAVSRSDFNTACKTLSPGLTTLLGKDCPAKLKEALADSKIDTKALGNAEVVEVVNSGNDVEDQPVKSSQPTPSSSPATPTHRASRSENRGKIVRLKYGDITTDVPVISRGNRWYVTLN